MKVVEKIELNIPDWALPILANGDYSSESINEEDIELIDKWQEEMRKDGFDPTCFSLLDEEPSFSYPEFGLPTNCYRCEFVKFE